MKGQPSALVASWSDFFFELKHVIPCSFVSSFILTMLTTNGPRINCTSGIHRATAAAMALQGYLMQEEKCDTVVIKHATLGGWDDHQAQLVEQWLETHKDKLNGAFILDDVLPSV